MGFIDNLNKKVEDKINSTISKPSKQENHLNTVAKTEENIKSLFGSFLLDEEKVEKIFGNDFGFAVVTDKRILIGSNFPEKDKRSKSLSFVSTQFISSVDYLYEKGLVLNEYKVSLGVSLKQYDVSFNTKEEAVLFHKEITKIIFKG